MKSPGIRRALVAVLVGALALGGVIAVPQVARADITISGGDYYTGTFAVGSTVATTFHLGITPEPTITVAWVDQTASNAMIGSGSTLTIPASAVGHAIVARATVTSGLVNGAISLNTAHTVAMGTTHADALSISGSFTDGQTLHASLANLTPAGSPVMYTWTLDGTTAIAGATAADFTLTSSDVGHGISVSARLGDGVAYSLSGLSSAVSSAIAPLPRDAARAFAVGSPKIVGTAKVGKTLKVAVGTWGPTPKFSYRWLANGRSISKATKSRITVTKSLKGKKISVKVTATKSGYTTVVKTTKVTRKVT